MAYLAHRRIAWPVAYTILLFPFLAFKSADVRAACLTIGTTTQCDATAPNPVTSTIGTGGVPAEDNRTVVVGNGAVVAVGDANAISLRDNANVTIRAGGTVSANGVVANGLYGTGANTIEFANNGVLTVEQGAQLLANGTQTSGEPVNLQGSGNTVVNNGLIRGANAAAVWFQNTTGGNTIINNATGVIQAPVDVIGSEGNASVNFTNRGLVVGNLVFAGGDDILHLYTGSSITGNLNGGGGNNTVYLNGTGTSSLPGTFNGFSSLYKADSGVWTLSGAISGITRAEVQGGTLVLTGNNTGYTGSVLVDQAGTLEARAQSLPSAVTDNGLVRFAQPDAGTYAGLLDGTGAVEKTGTGTLTLAPVAAGGNTYSGGTTLTQGAIAIAADSALGAGTGGLTFNGGVLQLNGNVNLAGTRAIVINAPGGTIDTQAFASTLSQGATGAGGLTKNGAGTLTLTGANTYAGGTSIAAGTLRIGNGGTSGSLLGDVANSATLAFDRADAAVFAGTITGTGMVAQVGTGTTILTANNGYTGGTTIAAGTLQLGNGGTAGSIAGDVANNARLSFARSDVATFAGTISGTGAVAQIGQGTTILNAANSYSGATNVAAGTLAIGDAAHGGASIGPGTALVQAGATLGGYGQATGAVVNAGTIAVANALPAFSAGPAGSFAILGGLTNAGTANVAGLSGQPGNTLRVAGDYSGMNGRLVLNTLLNAGGPASRSDQLVVGGNASGATAIQIHGSGNGAITSGDGIQIVQVGGAATATTFQLGSAVQAGAYQYLLYRGGAASANDWYLRSALNSPLQVPAASPVVTAYRPGVAGYTVTPSLIADYGFSILGQLHERVGDIANLDAAQPGNKDGVWGRVSGKNLDANASDRFSADERTFFAQFGKDWTTARNADGSSTHAGVTVTFGSSTATFEDQLRSLGAGLSNSTGSVETQAQSLGGYWTRYFADGAYFDGVTQLTHYHNKYGDIYGGGATQEGLGAGASGEVGKPFALGSTRLAVEPQAQLLYQYVHLNGTSDNVSQVSGNATNALRGRLGVRLFRANLPNDTGTGAATPYITANVLHDFFSPGRVSVGNTPFGYGLNKTWYELGVGVTASISKHGELYSSVKYSRNLGGEYRRGVFGEAGYRYSW